MFSQKKVHLNTCIVARVWRYSFPPHYLKISSHPLSPTRELLGVSLSKKENAFFVVAIYHSVVRFVCEVRGRNLLPRPTA